MNELIFDAFANHPRYEWRTSSAVAKQLNLDISFVTSVLAELCAEKKLMRSPANIECYGDPNRVNMDFVNRLRERSNHS